MPGTLTIPLILGAVVVILEINRWRGIRDERRKGYAVDVRGGVWRVTYREGQETLSLQFEMGGPGYPDILYVPSEEAWVRDMPGWAQHRRAQILRRIVAELGTRSWTYEIYEPGA